MKNEIENEIEARLQDDNWDEKIARMVVSRVEKKRRIQYTVSGLVFSTFFLIFLSFGMDLNIDVELSEIQNVYSETMEPVSLDGFEELISFME